MKFLSTCGILLAVMAIAIVTSPLAYGQAKPSGPAVGGGDRTLIPSTQRAGCIPAGLAVMAAVIIRPFAGA